MSSNSTVNLLIGAVIGVATAGIGWAVGFGYYAVAGMAAFSISSSLLNAAYATPTAPQQKPQDFSNAGRVFTGRQAASQQLEINSATEAIPIPVAFGTVRLGANHIRYDDATFRAVPVIERIQKSKEAVAYALARDTYRTSPAVVDREIDEAAKKRNGGGGKGGGKGGGGGSAPPSQQFSDKEKINQYTSDLLADDDTGTRRLPKEYDERTVAFKYYLTWELGICMGEVSKLHAVRLYPGEDVIIDRSEDPDIVADDTELTGEGGTQGGTIRFYRGSATQERNVADVYKEDYSNYRNVSFALMDDYWMGNQPAPQSYAFEVERIPVCLDEDGIEIADMETRAGLDTTAIAVSSASWSASEVTVNATAHGLTTGDIAYLAGFTPDAYNGTYVVTSTPTANQWVAAMMVAPETATTFGTSQGPDTAAPVNVSSASWAAGVLSLTATAHGLVVDQAFTVAGFTPSAYNGDYIATTVVDADHVTAVLVADPGTDTVQGTIQAHPLPVTISAATWEANLATYTTASDHGLVATDAVGIAGFIPTEWNGSLTVVEVISATEFTATLELDPGTVTVLGTSKKRPDASFGDANPAAIVYEILTNPTWGLGMSPALLDIPSFVAASEFFFDERTGMSFAMESQTDVGAVIEMVRSHVGMTLIWLGEKYYCRTILDRSTSYTPRFILTADQVIEPNVSRPAWSASVNELRATYTDRHNNYQAQIVAAHDDASIATIGRTNSRSINLAAFSNRETCEKAVQRLLSEAAYPQAVLKFQMNRMASHLFPTAFVEFRWDEWAAGTITTYWRVSEITDSDTDGGKISVTCVEDIYATAIEGTSATFTVPVPAYESMPRTTDEDLDFSDHAIHLDLGAFTVNLHEMSITMSDGDRVISIFSQKNDSRLHTLQVYYRAAAKGTLNFMALPAADETVTVAGTTYTWKASVGATANQVKIEATIAASIANLVAAITGGAGSGTTYGSATVAHTTVTAAIGTAYSATATLTAGGTPTDGQTVRIGSKTYTFKTTLTPAEGEVLIAGSTANALRNLARAINHNGTPDTDYYCAKNHPDVKATYTSTTTTITARTPGRAGNAIVLAETLTGTPWDSGVTTMSGGSDRAPGREPGLENTMLVTAISKGVDANAYTTTTTSDCIAWLEATMEGGTDYLPIGNVTPWAITGTLVEEFAAGLITTRTGVFEIQLDRPEERARFLTYCSTAPTDDDHLDAVAGAQTNWLVIGGEFIQIAQAEAGSQSNRVRCTAYIRQQYGSEQATHAAGTPASFVYDFVPYDNTLRYDQIPIDEEVEIQVIPADRRGLTSTPATFLHTFTGEARKPLRITRIEQQVTGQTWDVTYRPRWHNRGAETFADLEQDLSARAIEVPTGYETYVMPVDASGYDLADDPVKVAIVYTPEADDDADSGMIDFSYEAPTDTAALLIYQSFDGVLGLPATTT